VEVEAEAVDEITSSTSLLEMLFSSNLCGNKVKGVKRNFVLFSKAR